VIPNSRTGIIPDMTGLSVINEEVIPNSRTGIIPDMTGLSVINEV